MTEEELVEKVAAAMYEGGPFYLARSDEAEAYRKDARAAIAAMREEGAKFPGDDKPGRGSAGGSPGDDKPGQGSAGGSVAMVTSGISYNGGAGGPGTTALYETGAGGAGPK